MREPGDAISPALRALLALALGLVSACAHASFYTSPEGRLRVAAEAIEYRIDDGKPADVAALAASSEGWVSKAKQPFVAGDGRIALWARFTIPAEAANRAVYISTPGWEALDFYFVRRGQVVSHQRAGTLLPKDERAAGIVLREGIVYPGLAEIALVAGEPTTVIAHLVSEQRYVGPALSFAVWDTRKVDDAESAERFPQGLFYGMMLFLIVYNLGLFLVTRESSYLAYVVMETGFTMAWAVMFGQAFEYLWPAHPVWDYYGFWWSMCAGGFGAAMFIRHYLDTRSLFPRIDRFVDFLLAMPLVLFPIAFLPGVTLDTLGNIALAVGPLTAPLVIGIVVHAWRKHHPLAANLTLALLCFTAGEMAYAGAYLGVFPINAFTEHALQAGSAAMGLILSFGIALRIRRMGREIARAEHERLALVEVQKSELETKVAERTAQLEHARDRSDALLANILPRPIIEELAERGTVEPRRHEEVSILFTDFEGFTSAVAMIPARRLVEELDEVFRAFDEIVAAHGLEKIKTIGDAYMAAAGLPLPAADHAQRCVAAGLAMCAYIEQRNSGSAMKWGLRVGVHSGAVVAGIVGKDKYAYDVWGDTVNIASRLESAGAAGRVNVSAYTYELVRGSFACDYRGKVAAKGKGDVDMYFVVAAMPASSQPAPSLANAASH